MWDIVSILFRLTPAGSIIGGAAKLWGADFVTAKLVAVFTALAVLILQLPLAISNLFLGIAVKILGVVTSPRFISLPYTKLDNPIIKMGWTVTRDLANMGIVLALVIIGIATILKIESYQIKKTLPVLIIIALLINFTPVILGVIVDASNILMHYFLGDAMDASAFAETFSEQYEIVTRAWSNIFAKAGQREGGPDLTPLGQTIALTSFGFIAGFIYITFAFIFLLRYIAIWMLVILSPLAFVCFILPKTKPYFDKWWDQFLQWCFVGVFAAFFLYLSNGLLALARGQELLGKTGLVGAKLPVPAEEAQAAAGVLKELPTTTGLLNTLLPYYVVIGFLVLGIVATLSISAMGASTLINLSKRGHKGAWRGTKWIGGRIAQRGIRPLTERMRLKEAAGWVSRKVEKAPVARWFLPEKLRKYGEMRPAIDKAQERAKPYSSQTLAHRIKTGADVQTDATGALREMIETRGDAEDLFKEVRKEKPWREGLLKSYAGKRGKKVEDLTAGEQREAISDREILRYEPFRKRLTRPLEIAAKAGLLSSRFLRPEPRLARLVAGKDSKTGKIDKKKKWAGVYSTMTEEEAVQEATRQARRQHYTQMERESLEDRTLVETTMEKGRDIPEAISRDVKKGQETMLKTIDTLFSEYIEKTLSKTNAALANKIKAGDAEAIETAWDEDYRKFFRSKHEDRDGYFEYVKGQRAKEIGWRKGRYMTEKDRGAPPSSAVPGKEMEMASPKKKKKGPPETGAGV